MSFLTQINFKEASHQQPHLLTRFLNWNSMGFQTARPSITIPSFQSSAQVAPTLKIFDTQTHPIGEQTLDIILHAPEGAPGLWSFSSSPALSLESPALSLQSSAQSLKCTFTDNHILCFFGVDLQPSTSKTAWSVFITTFSSTVNQSRHTCS